MYLTYLSLPRMGVFHKVTTIVIFGKFFTLIDFSKVLKTASTISLKVYISAYISVINDSNQTTFFVLMPVIPRCFFFFGAFSGISQGR